MGIFITGPLAIPGGITATVLAGGTLVASTTYYYRICAQNSSNDYFRRPSTRKSAWSVESSFVTTVANRSVRFDWLASPGAVAYTVFVSTVSGAYVGTFKCGASSTSCTVGNVLTYTLTAPPTQTSGSYWLGVSSTSAPKPGGLAVDQGSIIVDISGSETLASVNAAIVAAGYGAFIWFDGSTFILDGSFNITNRGTTGSFYIWGVDFWLLSGYANDLSSGITVYFGESVAGGGYRRTTMIRLLSTVSQVYGTFCANTVISGCIMTAHYLDSWSTASGLKGDYRLGVGASFPVLKDAVFTDGAMLTPDPGAYLYRFSQAHLLASGTNVIADYVWLKSPGTSYFWYQQVSTAAFIYRSRCVGAVAATDELYCSDNMVSQQYVRLYDCLFPAKSTNIPRCYWRQYTVGSTMFHLVEVYYTLIITVVDTAGAVIAGATVTISDVFGTVVGTYTSTADGLVFAETGTLTAATGTILTDTAKAWVVNIHQGKEIYVASGSASGLIGIVLSNTATALTLHDTLTVVPAIGDRIGFALAMKTVQLAHKVGTAEGAGPAFTTQTDYGPFTVTISKTGYRTAIINRSISAKTNWVVALETNLGHSAVM